MRRPEEIHLRRIAEAAEKWVALTGGEIEDSSGEYERLEAVVTEYREWKEAQSKAETEAA